MEEPVKLEPNHPEPFECASQRMIATKLLDAIRELMEQDPQAARAAAARLVDFLTDAANEQAAQQRGLAAWRKRKIERYLLENLDRRLRLETLAEHVSLSVSQFARAFKVTFQATPRRHILDLRLTLARRLMLTTNDPLSQIALACGLADQAHFSKLFRREFGDTPSAWRRRNLTDAQGEARRAAGDE